MAPEYDGNGLPYDKWLAVKHKEMLAKKHSSSGLSAILKEDYGITDGVVGKAKSYVYNKTFEEWERSKSQTRSLKR